MLNESLTASLNEYLNGFVFFSERGFVPLLEYFFSERVKLHASRVAVVVKKYAVGDAVTYGKSLQLNVLVNGSHSLKGILIVSNPRLMIS